MTEERERWARVQELFLEALERPPSERGTYLAEASADDRALVAEVLSLLDAHEEGPIADAPAERPWGGRHPERIGSYRIVRPLGEGGMGAVLLAVREAQGFNQTVALKVLHAGFPHRDLERRLQAERRILARLEHPGIARLIDGGLTEHGQPFFAMEYVKGEDLLTWCDARRLDVSGRVRLFLDVCDAVRHAHQQLVIHRDLKPSNILVTAAGRAKLLDFGVAKLVDEDADDGRTRTAAWVTPAYASPEQLRGDPVSTLSDVYALGVLLYELLVGLRPYRAEGRNPLQLERALARERPAPPSRAAVDDGGAGGTDLATGRPDAATRASLRGVAGAERLRRQLAGDLDVIIARALAHDPERRYGSVAALAEDLSRYLNGWPVHAQRDGFSYRASKFVKRHRIAVAAAALGTAAVLIGAATTTWQARRARDAAIRAEAEAGRARQVTALVTDLFRLSDPTRTRGDTVTARQLLDEGTARIERELVGQPTLQATLLDEVAKVYRNLGLLPRAEELGRRVLELREVLDPGSRGHAAALATLGEVVTERGRPQEGVDLYRTALALPGLGASADADTLRARVQAGLAWALRDLGRHEEAAQLFREALGAQRPTLGDGSPTTARTLMGLASALHDEGRFDEAEALFAESLLGNPAPDRPEAGVAAALANLGMLRRLRQDYLGAEPMLRTALTFRTTLFGPDHPETLASMDSWGAELLELGRPAEARAVLADARERAIAVSGANHSATVSITEALAWALDDLGDYRVAEALRDSAIATKRRSRGGDHAGIVYSLIRQARGAREAGRIDRAAGILDSARAMGRRLSEEEGVYRALGLHEEAHVASARGDRPLAERAFTDAERLLRERLREDHRYVLAVTRDRALFRLRSGADPDSVVAVLERVEEAQARHRPSPHPERARTALALGEARLAAGDARGAARAFEAAEDALSTIPPAHWLRGAARVGRGLAEGRPDWIDAGQRVVEAHLGADAPEARRLRAAGSARQP